MAEKSGCSTTNVFSGSTSVQDYLNPDNYPPTPLVELPESLNPHLADGVHIYAKLMYMLPLLNIKSLPAMNMLMEAKTAGRLEGVHTLVESSSGNTVSSIAVLASLFNIPRTVAIVPWDIAQGKLEILRLTGAEPHLKRDIANTPSGIQDARAMGERDGFYNAGQYENADNPAAYEKWLAPSLWEQLQGKLSVFGVGLGTTGTLVGCGRWFRKHKHNVAMVGAICAPEEAVPGVRSLARLKEIQFDWKLNADAIVEVATAESYRASLQMCRKGIMAGPSSGFALAGLRHYLDGKKADGTLDAIRNADGDVVAAIICGDTPYPYLDKYTTHLDPSDF